MIDWSRVRELRDEIGQDDFREVVDLFLAEVAIAIAEMKTSPPTASLRAQQMHFLKGSALNLGFRDLSRLCQAGESAALAGDVTAVTPAQIELAYSTSKADFLALLHKKIGA